jgi:hypothetical protein
MKFIGSDWQAQAKKEGPAVMVAMSVVSGLMSIKQGMDAKKDAKAAAAEQERIARENAAFKEAETVEQARRMQEEEDSAAAKRRAMAASTGIATDQASSLDIFMGAQEDKFSKELDWLRKSGASQADIINKQGSLAANITRSQGEQAKWQGISSGIGSVASGVSTGYKAYTNPANTGKNWWDWKA